MLILLLSDPYCQYIWKYIVIPHRLHYAKTLRIWLENLIAAQERVVDIYGEEVFRTFKYYLAWYAPFCYPLVLYKI